MKSFISQILYSFKRKTVFHRTITFTRQIFGTIDIVTGQRTITTNRCVVLKGFYFSEAQTRKFAYDLSFIAANKNFTYGGTFDHYANRLIIESKDLIDENDEAFEIKLEDKVSIGGVDRTFSVKFVTTVNNEAHLVGLEAVKQ